MDALKRKRDFIGIRVYQVNLPRWNHPRKVIPFECPKVVSEIILNFYRIFSFFLFLFWWGMKVYSELSFGDWKCHSNMSQFKLFCQKKVKSWKWLYFLKFYSWSDFTNYFTCRMPYFKPSSTESRFWVGGWKYPKNISFCAFPIWENFMSYIMNIVLFLLLSYQNMS